MPPIITRQRAAELDRRAMPNSAFPASCSWKTPAAAPLTCSAGWVLPARWSSVAAAATTVATDSSSPGISICAGTPSASSSGTIPPRPDDAATNFRILERSGIPIVRLTDASGLAEALSGDGVDRRRALRHRCPRRASPAARWRDRRAQRLGRSDPGDRLAQRPGLRHRPGGRPHRSRRGHLHVRSRQARLPRPGRRPFYRPDPRGRHRRPAEVGRRDARRQVSLP